MFQLHFSVEIRLEFKMKIMPEILIEIARYNTFHKEFECYLLELQQLIYNKFSLMFPSII